MPTLIFGGPGYLGTYFAEQYPDAATPSVDIADRSAVQAALDEHKPDVVINCAGKTGRPNVDWCEDHKLETMRSNVTGPLVIAEECAERGMYFVQLGSGCIYTGDESTPFTEDDAPNYMGSFYSRTKAWIDQMLIDLAEEGAGVLIIRPRMPFDGTENPRNLIMKIKQYDKLIDTPNSITYVPDLLNVTDQLIQKRARGAYNVVNPGSMSAARIMTLYQEIVDPSHTFDVISLDDLKHLVKAGRSNCILSTAKLEGEGIVLQSAEEAVVEALNALSL